MSAEIHLQGIPRTCCPGQGVHVFVTPSGRLEDPTHCMCGSGRNTFRHRSWWQRMLGLPRPRRCS